jgi:hypothetical protein
MFFSNPISFEIVLPGRSTMLKVSDAPDPRPFNPLDCPKISSQFAVLSSQFSSRNYEL